MTVNGTGQLWPPVLDPKTLQRQVWDTETARRIPGVGRALDLYGGLISQMPMDDFRGIVPLTRPRLLDQPDLDLARSTFVLLHVEDYLLHGNAAHLITAFDSNGRPAAVKWYPASAWNIVIGPGNERRWYLYGKLVPTELVVHVQRGADPAAPWRGVGVVERYVRSLDRIGLQEESERVNLTGGQVPSVAVITPQREDQLTQTQIDAAALKWEEKFSGPGRRPAFLPNGTTVTPLGWSPEDQQATAARLASLTDVANMFNLDPYWIGAPGSSHTYRSPGPLFVNLLRTSLEPILAPFEDVWSLRWLPNLRRVRFFREGITSDDFGSTIATLTNATGGKAVMSLNEARARIGLAPVDGGDDVIPVIPPQLDPANDDPETDPNDDPETEDPEAA